MIPRTEPVIDGSCFLATLLKNRSLSSSSDVNDICLVNDNARRPTESLLDSVSKHSGHGKRKSKSRSSSLVYLNDSANFSVATTSTSGSSDMDEFEDVPDSMQCLCSDSMRFSQDKFLSQSPFEEEEELDLSDNESRWEGNVNNKGQDCVPLPKFPIKSPVVGATRKSFPGCNITTTTNNQNKKQQAEKKKMSSSSRRQHNSLNSQMLQNKSQGLSPMNRTSMKLKTGSSSSSSRRRTKTTTTRDNIESNLEELSKILDQSISIARGTDM